MNKNGAAGCVEKCHTKDDCVKCHTSRKVVPDSHKARASCETTRARTPGTSSSTRRTARPAPTATATAAIRTRSSARAATSSRCRTRSTTAASRSSRTRKASRRRLKKVQCANCHKTVVLRQLPPRGLRRRQAVAPHHPDVVKKDGAEPCFECHEEMYCSNCHVNLAKQGLQSAGTAQSTRRGPGAGRALARCPHFGAQRRPLVSRGLARVGRASIAPRRDVAQLGRALGSGPRGRGFESRHPDHSD